MDFSKRATIVLFGRSGAGKSALGNKLAQKQIFLEGNTLNSQTDSVTAEEFIWPLDLSLIVRLIDTPGLADNRVDMTDEQLLAQIINFLVSLKNKVDLILLCLPAKSRVDIHDIEEIELLGLLLGKEVFDHVYIAITQTNTFQEENKQELYQKYEEELPSLLAKHNLSGFTKEKILFADFDSFQQDFSLPLTEIIRKTTPYVPKIAEEIDPNSPESIKKFLASPEMKSVMKKYENKIAQQREQMKGMENLMADQAEQNNKQIQENLHNQENHERRLAEISQKLREQKEQNEDMKKQYEQEQQEIAQKLEEAKKKHEALCNQNKFYEVQLSNKRRDLQRMDERLEGFQTLETVQFSNQLGNKQNYLGDMEIEPDQNFTKTNLEPTMLSNGRLECALNQNEGASENSQSREDQKQTTQLNEMINHFTISENESRQHSFEPHNEDQRQAVDYMVNRLQNFPPFQTQASPQPVYNNPIYYNPSQAPLHNTMSFPSENLLNYSEHNSQGSLKTLEFDKQIQELKERVDQEERKTFRNKKENRGSCNLI